MSLIYAVEAFSKAFPEIAALVPIQEQETRQEGLGASDVVFQPDWMKILGMEKSGNLLTCTVREDGRLVGYIVFIGYTDLQRQLTNGKPLLIAHDLAHYVVKDKRGPRVALRLFAFAEVELRVKGVRRISIHAKPHLKGGRLLSALGFIPQDIVYSKYTELAAVEDAPAETMAQAPKAA